MWFPTYRMNNKITLFWLGSSPSRFYVLSKIFTAKYFVKLFKLFQWVENMFGNSSLLLKIFLLYCTCSCNEIILLALSQSYPTFVPLGAIIPSNSMTCLSRSRFFFIKDLNSFVDSLKHESCYVLGLHVGLLLKIQ